MRPADSFKEPCNAGAVLAWCGETAWPSNCFSIFTGCRNPYGGGGLATPADYGISIDEFNANDYGPKARAWYTSGFTDRSHFENVEFSLWYYGPWFQILTAFVPTTSHSHHLGSGYLPACISHPAMRHPL
jgi:hypothetical protein